MTSQSPNCYGCKHRISAIGSCHSQCMHPKSGNTEGNDLFGADLVSLVLIAHGLLPVAALDMQVTAVQHGVVNGWCSWPYNFDPVWLRSCNGFEPIEQMKTD